MAKEDDVIKDADFEKLLDSFINAKIEDKNDENPTANKNNDISEKIETETEEDDDENDDVINLSVKGEEINNEITENDLDQELLASLSDAKDDIADDKEVTLGTDESELAQAFINFYNSVNKLSTLHLGHDFTTKFYLDDLYPNYKPSLSEKITNDLAAGWLLLAKIFPDQVGKFPINSTDEEFLIFAEKLPNQDLQVAIISYVEVLIDMESCELSYKLKLAKYQEKFVKRMMYEEYLARKERQRKFTEAVKAKDFPIDAERLISNYFRVAQKDVNGAFKALTTNPAIFAPIDFNKIKPRFFGLIKVSPKDGIRVNMEIGNFLKKLKV